MRRTWLALGACADHVLATWTGREQLERVARWTKGASRDVGVSMAAEQVAESALIASERTSSMN